MRDRRIGPQNLAPHALRPLGHGAAKVGAALDLRNSAPGTNARLKRVENPLGPTGVLPKGCDSPASAYGAVFVFPIEVTFDEDRTAADHLLGAMPISRRNSRLKLDFVLKPLSSIASVTLIPFSIRLQA